jgi:hypothetical protein
MPIGPFLYGERPDPETKRLLSVAFEMTCIALRVEGSDDFVKQAIAAKIIELAKTGERNPDILCEQALKEIRGSASSRADAGPLGTPPGGPNSVRSQ